MTCFFKGVITPWFVFSAILAIASVSNARGESSLAESARIILRTHCHQCHGAGGSNEGGMNYVLNLRRLVSTGNVIADHANNSPLLERIVEGEMPPEEIRRRPTKNEVAVLRKWIMAGAPMVESQKRELVSRDEMVELILADVQQAEPRQRRFLRYFALTHLYNAGVSDDELQTYRLALGKLINSLSWARTLVHPHPIDKARTIFRLDIRDVRWTRETWDDVSSLYPYGIRYESESAAALYEATQTPLPFVHADWFLSVASRPPLYHLILELPETVDDLQRQLRIDFRVDVRQDRVARAGFVRSGAATHPRIIEHHETRDGSCWVSYDFSASTGKKNFFNHPLDFESDASEIIFHLPNGLQAYMLADADGDRQDAAPQNIVKDQLQPDAAIVNGISCMRCHASGIIPKRDEVRRNLLANPLAFADQLDDAKALYVPEQKFDQLLKRDRDAFREVLRQLGIGGFSEKAEPIYSVAARFGEPLDVTLAAAELGLAAEALDGRIADSADLQRLIGVLRVQGGSVRREVFSEAFGELVTALDVGKYIPPPDLAAFEGTLRTTTGSGRLFDFVENRRLPNYLDPKVTYHLSKDGLEMKPDHIMRTRATDYLSKREFILELVLTIPPQPRRDPNQRAVFIGIGNGGLDRLWEPQQCVRLRLDEPIRKGVVTVAKTGADDRLDRGTRQALGRIAKAGTHRIRIHLKQNTLTFRIDVDNDGASPDDLETTIANIKEYAPFLNDKNAYLFFTGEAFFKKIRLQSRD